MGIVEFYIVCSILIVFHMERPRKRPISPKDFE